MRIPKFWVMANIHCMPIHSSIWTKNRSSFLNLDQKSEFIPSIWTKIAIHSVNPDKNRKFIPQSGPKIPIHSFKSYVVLNSLRYCWDMNVLIEMPEHWCTSHVLLFIMVLSPVWQCNKDNILWLVRQTGAYFRAKVKPFYIRYYFAVYC